MLYFQKQTFNKHESQSVVFGLNPLYLLKHCQLLTSTDFSYGGFTTLPHLTLMSFEARGVKLKCARLLKIGSLAFCQERTVFIVSKFKYTTCLGSRPDKLKPISWGTSSEWYAIIFSLKLASQIIYMSI